MNTVQRIAKNTSMLFASQIVRHLISFLYMIFTARHLGPLNFGILTFALAFTSIFGVVCDFGLQTLTTREVARDKSSALKYIINISWMKIILCTAAFGMIALTINLFGYPKLTVTVVYLLGLSTVLSTFNTMFYSIFQAYEQMEYQSFGQILHSVSMFVGVVLAIKCNFSVTGFAALYFLASIVILAYNFAILRTKFPNLLSGWSQKITEVDWKFWKSTIKEALPFGLAITFMIIFYWIDSVMLSLMKGDIVVGWYNAAYRMVLALLFIPNSFIAAIYPVMSRHYQTSRSALQLSFIKSFKYLTILGIPIGFGTTLLAKKFILIIFGTEYINSILSLQILIWSLVFIFMSQPFGNLFNCLNRQVIVLKTTASCVVLNIILNLLLIPKYSLIGASVATVLTEFVSLILLVFFSIEFFENRIDKVGLLNISIKVLFSSLLIFFFIRQFHDLYLIILIPLVALIYFAILYLTKVISKEDMSLIKQMNIWRSNEIPSS